MQSYGGRQNLGVFNIFNIFNDIFLKFNMILILIEQVTINITFEKAHIYFMRSK